MQNEKNFKIVKVRSDHGGEFETKILKISLILMEYLMISPDLELHNKMEL